MSKNMRIQGPQINQFNNVMVDKVPRSAFRRDFTRRTTFNSSYLVPVFVDEILPGDEVSLDLTALVRMSTPIKPLMDNLYFETFFFFVPNRLLWDNWKKFQGEQVAPGDSTVYSIPVLNSTVAPLSTTGFLNQGRADYFGIPTLVTNLSNINALPFRAYDLVYNEWFRDENLQNPQTVPTGDGPDNPALADQLARRNKRKDYRTSALPWPQKGTAVSVSLGGFAPVALVPGTTNAAQVVGVVSGNRPTGNGNMGFLATSGDVINSATTERFKIDPNGTLRADLSASTPITINALRQAALYQQILELDARGGTRYVESIFSRFGVVSPDFRLQRPELIGQGSSRINVYAVPQTAPSASGATPQGNLAGFGVGQINGGHSARYAATEHGYILGLMNVRADLTYQQALPRMFSRRTRLDFYEPLLNGLGEQSILRKEVVAQGTAADDEVFAYAERFSEYRWKDSEITGKFRSNDPQSLQIWHLSQQLSSPTLTSAFITDNVPMARVLAVPTEPEFLGDMFFRYNHVRPMPIRSNPGIDKL